MITDTMKCKNCNKLKEEHFKRNVRTRNYIPHHWNGMGKMTGIMQTGVEQKLFCSKTGKKEYECSH